MTLNLIFAKPIFIKPSQNIQTLLSASLNTVKYFLYTQSKSFFLIIFHLQMETKYFNGQMVRYGQPPELHMYLPN